MQSFSPAFLRGKPFSGNQVAVWTAVSEHLDSTRNTWDYLNRAGKCPHYLWNPRTGDLVTGVSHSYSGTLYPGTGYVVAVMADPKDPFTSYPLDGSVRLCEALSALGVPEVWPYGPPLSYGHPRASQRVFPPGHYSADQINPEWTGVGPIDIRRIHGTHSA